MAVEKLTVITYYVKKPDPRAQTQTAIPTPEQLRNTLDQTGLFSSMSCGNAHDIFKTKDSEYYRVTCAVTPKSGTTLYTLRKKLGINENEGSHFTVSKNAEQEDKEEALSTIISVLRLGTILCITSEWFGETDPGKASSKIYTYEKMDCCEKEIK